MNSTVDLLSELRIDRSISAPQRKRSTWIVAAPVLVLIVIAVAAGSSLDIAAKPLEVRTTRASAASRPPNASVLDATGYVTARRTATVSANVTGRLKEVLFEEGQYVDAGQVMATLDSVDATAQQRLVGAQLAASRSHVREIEVQLELAEADARRHAALATVGFIGPAALEQRVAQRESLRAQLQAARHNVEAAVGQARIANNGLENTVVRAPFAGVVVAKTAQPGEIVSPLSAGGGFTRTGIGTLVDMNSLEIEVNVNESYIGRVAPKMRVDAVLNAYPGVNFPAEVIAIIPTADRNKATVKVRIAFKDKDPRVVPDMGVKVSFLEAGSSATSAPLTQGVMVAADAIAIRDGKPVAFVVDDTEQVERRDLKLGAPADGGVQQVLAGLQVGESVVLKPPAALAQGQQVRALLAVVPAPRTSN